MSKLIVTGLVLTVSVGAALIQAEDVPEFPKPQKEHEWLQQLVGEWESEATMFMEPEQPPVTSKGTESVRSVGGFWIVAENKGTFMETPFTGLLTLGYDAEKKRYVGTWVDSVQAYLWTYQGAVDEAGKVLTLETEGPCPAEPGKMSRFKEVLEIRSKDHKVFTSSMQGEDGKWNIMVRIEYRRKK